eukprot:TRINITY_DN11384_c0_g1_i1.p1 TRINITY_DN11384_c0_g1~~TRINITY_DN11384_c0_g1_i1.p1  ORF type:complete len:467 (-),score=70.31 TRINITY_DN11384_c0_g1_i1:46-1386(-)
MSGFVEYEADAGHKSEDYCNVMQGFKPDRVPVTSFLASEFAVFDEYFCSVPGPTWPNRQFALSATSEGQTSVGPWYQNKAGKLFPQRTIFDQVADAGLTWRNYYVDTPWELFLKVIADHPQNLRDMNDFHRACASGSLPSFSWVNPRSGVNVTTGDGPSDEHPDHDVLWGEALLKEVYDAVRASPLWERTVLLVTWDEAGGFYDHVPPPNYAPDPYHGTTYPDAGFKFDRLGERVPLIVVSPFVQKGLVVGKANTTAFDHTSMIGTTRKWLDIEAQGALNSRDAWSETFEWVLNLENPRADIPRAAPVPPPPEQSVPAVAKQAHSDIQNHILQVTSHLAGHRMSYAPDLTTHDVSVLTQQHFGTFMTQRNSAAGIAVLPCIEYSAGNKNWWLNATGPGSETFYLSTASSLSLSGELCLSTKLQLEACTFSGSQVWLWTANARKRNF